MSTVARRIGYCETAHRLSRSVGRSFAGRRFGNYSHALGPACASVRTMRVPLGSAGPTFYLSERPTRSDTAASALCAFSAG